MFKILPILRCALNYLFHEGHGFKFKRPRSGYQVPRPPYVELELRTWNRELPRTAHFFGNKTSFSVAITAG